MGNVSSSDISGDVLANTSTPQGVAGTVQLYCWVKARRTGSWELVSEDAKVGMYNAHEDANNKTPEWHLEIDGPQEPVDAIIDDEYIFDAEQHRVTFSAGDETWALRFPNTSTFNLFLQKYNRAVFENRFAMELNEINEVKIFGDDFMMRLGPETKESRQAWVEDMDIDDQPHPNELKTPTKDKAVGNPRESPIHGVVMGAGDRSFLLREGQLDVMRNVMSGVEDTGLALVLKTPPGTSGSTRRGSITPTSGGFLPSKALLAQGETAINMITPEKSSSLFHTDLETGKVVSEWSFMKDHVEVPMKDISSDTKASQLDHSSTFLALGENRLARWDLRDRKGAVQEAMSSPAALSYMAGKDYASRPKFNCMATSGDGFIAIGSNDGKVRLYSEKTLTQAKTSIPGLGLPITSIDVTFDGKWVLATTKSYLMVMKTTYRDPTSGKELCGFTNKMGSHAPAPRLLRLKPEDAALTGHAPLKGGHFAWVTERGKQERWIVASCGNYTVLWNFRSVKVSEQGLVSYGGLTTITGYNLIPKEEAVVDSVFLSDRHMAASARGARDAMVVVTKKQVFNIQDDENEED